MRWCLRILDVFFQFTDLQMKFLVVSVSIIMKRCCFSPLVLCSEILRFAWPLALQMTLHLHFLSVSLYIPQGCDPKIYLCICVVAIVHWIFDKKTHFHVSRSSSLPFNARSFWRLRNDEFVPVVVLLSLGLALFGLF